MKIQFLFGHLIMHNNLTANIMRREIVKRKNEENGRGEYMWMTGVRTYEGTKVNGRREESSRLRQQGLPFIRYYKNYYKQY